MEIAVGIYMVLVTWFAIDTKVELEELKDQPPRIERVIETVEVKVPVSSKCPSPKPIDRPDLAIHKLTKNDKGNYSKIADAYVVSLSQCMSYGSQQAILLESYYEPGYDEND